MKLYDGCYGVLNNGEVVGPMRYTTSRYEWPFRFDGGSWRADGALANYVGSPASFRSIHPTREEAEAAARGETVKRTPLEAYKPKSPFMQGFTDWKAWVGGIVVGLIVAYFLFGCTSPTEPAPCKFQEHTFSHDSQKDTVICLDNSAYGRG